MRETDATSWAESPEGYVITVRWRKRENRRYLVPVGTVEGAEQALEADTYPLRVRLEDFRQVA